MVRRMDRGAHTSWFLAIKTRRALPPTDFLELRLCGRTWLVLLEKLFSSVGARLRGCMVALPDMREEKSMQTS